MPLGHWEGVPGQSNYVVPRAANTPAWKLLAPTQAQVTAFESFLGSMTSYPYIGAAGTLTELSTSGRSYDVRFVHAGQQFGAQAGIHYFYSKSRGFVMTAPASGPSGSLTFNLDAIAPNGAIDQSRMNEFGSHEISHYKYGPHFYDVRETWPYPRAPNSNELRQDGVLNSQVIQAWLAGNSVQAYDANGNAIPGILYSRTNGATQGQFDSSFYRGYELALQNVWAAKNGARGGYAATLAEIGITVVDVPADYYGIEAGDIVLHTDANGVLLALVGSSQRPFPVAEFAQIFGSTLGRQLAGENLVLGTVYGSILGVIGLNVGQQYSAASGNLQWANTPNGMVAAVGSTNSNVWLDFANELSDFTANATIGATSSWLAAALGEAMGLDGFGSELFSTGAGSILGHTLTNLASDQAIFNGFNFGRVEWWSKGDLTPAGSAALVHAFGSFLGVKLASLVAQPQTQAAAALSSLGAAAGTFAALNGIGIIGSFARAAASRAIGGLVSVGLNSAGWVNAAFNLLAPGVGAFIGFVLGALIGNLFGRKKPRIPTANAETVLQIPNARYELGAVTQANAGNLDLVRSMGMAARDTLNGLIDTVTRGDETAKVSNTFSPTQVYGHTGGQLWVKLGGQGAAQTNVNSADDAVDKGVLYALPATQIVGGDLFLKRALYNQIRHPGQAPNVAALSGDLQIAEDYVFYLQNRAVIDAMIAEPYTSMSAAQKAFYDANKAFMTRALAKESVPLTGGDVAFYQQNQTMVDGITSSLNLTQFAAAWIITLQRAAELELDRTSPGDFYGGAKGFIDSLALTVAGQPIDYETVVFDPRGADLSVAYAPVGTARDANMVAGPAGADVTWAIRNQWLGPDGVPFEISYRDIDGETAMVARTQAAEPNGTLRQAGSVGFKGPVGDAHFEVQPGETIGYALEAKALTNHAQVFPHVHWYNEAGGYVGSVGVGADVLPGGGWVRIAGTATVPTGARFARIEAYVSLTTSPGQPVEVAYRRPQVHHLATGQAAPAWAGASYSTFVATNLAADAGISSAWAAPEFAKSNFYSFASWSSGVLYNDTWTENGVTYSGGDDIVIGSVHGDALSGATGHDWVDGGAGADTLNGNSGDDVLIGRHGDDLLWGDAGDDYLAGGPGDEFWWAASGHGRAGLRGGDGNDTLVGGAGVDSLFGEGGNDTVLVDEETNVNWYLGYVEGASEPNGQNDTLSFERFRSPVTFALSSTLSDFTYYSAANYYFGAYQFENVTGSTLADNLSGNDYKNVLKGLAGDDVLSGGFGDDVLEGGQGADTLSGGDGADTVSYQGSSSAVWVDLTAQEYFGGDAEGDVLTSSENLTGSNFADTLGGNHVNNGLSGLKGDDWFTWSPGFDTYEGGDGFDTVDFSGITTSLDGLAVGLGYSVACGVWVNFGAYFGGAYLGWQAAGALTGVEHVVGTQFLDHLHGDANDQTFTGGKGNDYLTGQNGSDTFVFNVGDGVDTIDETSDGANSIVFGDGVDWSKLAIGWSGSTLNLFIRGTSDQLILNGSMINWNHKIKSIDMAGAGAVDINPVNWLLNGTDGVDVFAGGSRDWVMGYGGDDQIGGAPGYGYEVNQNLIVGGRGNDSIGTSVGDDQFVFERGDGADTITDAGGDDTIVFGPTVAAEDVIFKVVGRDLYVGVRDLANPALEAHQVADRMRIVEGGTIFVDVYENNGELIETGRTLNTIEFVVAGGASIDLTKLDVPWSVEYVYTGGGGGGGGGEGGGFTYIPPLVFDLGGDGLDLVSVAESNVIFQPDNGAPLFRIGWVDGQDGILALDRNKDGVIDTLNEITFTQDRKGAKTDLEGLAAFDLNDDGVLNEKDPIWSDLRVWRDVNGNGLGAGKELQTLQATGIAAFELAPRPTGFTTGDGIDNAVVNTTTFQWATGGLGTAYDVKLAMRLAHIDGLATGKPLAGWGQASATGAIGGVVAAPGNAEKVTVAIGATAAPAQSLIFTRQSTALEGTLDLPPVVRKRSTIAELEEDLAKGTPTISAGKGLPIIIDLDDDGLTLVDASQSSVHIDLNQDGWSDKIGWSGASEGILGLDRDGDGRISGLSEISFVADMPGAQTDLEGLSAFDTDGDMRLTAADSAFDQFMIWRDADGDGRSKAAELRGLAATGIVSIDLSIADKAADNGGPTANAILGTTTVTLDSGAVRIGYDVALGSLSGLALAAASQGVNADVLASAPDGVDRAGPIFAPWAMGRDVRRAILGSDDAGGDAPQLERDDGVGADLTDAAELPGRNRVPEVELDDQVVAGPSAQRSAFAQTAPNTARDKTQSEDALEGVEGAPRREKLRDRRWWATIGQGDEPRGRGGRLSGLMAMLEEPASALAAGEDAPRGADRAMPVVDPALAASSDQLIQAMAAFRPDRGANIRSLTGTTLGDADGLASVPARWRRDRLKA